MRGSVAMSIDGAPVRRAVAVKASEPRQRSKPGRCCTRRARAHMRGSPGCRRPPASALTTPASIQLPDELHGGDSARHARAPRAQPHRPAGSSSALLVAVAYGPGGGASFAPALLRRSRPGDCGFSCTGGSRKKIGGIGNPSIKL